MYYVTFPGHISFFQHYNDAFTFAVSLPDLDDLLIDVTSSIQLGKIDH